MVELPAAFRADNGKLRHRQLKPDIAGVAPTANSGFPENRPFMLVRVIKNFSSQLLGLAVSLADRFVLPAVLLRAWSPNLFADWSTIMALCGLLSLADFGLATMLGNRLQKAYAVGNEAMFKRTLGIGLFAYAVVSTLMVAAIAALAVAVAHGSALALHQMPRADAAILIVLLGIAQMLHTTRSSISQIYRGRDQFARGSVIDSIALLGIGGTLVAAGACGLGPIELAVALLCAQVIFGWGLNLAGLHWFTTVELRPVVPSRNDLRQALLSLRWYFLGSALPVLWLQLPIIILGNFSHSGSVLVTFVLHRTLVNFCRTFTAMISMSAGIEIARFVHAKDHVGVQKRLEIIGVASGAINGVMIAGLLTFVAPFISIWSGNSSAPDMATLLWLALPAILLAPTTPLVHVALLSDLPRPLAMGQLVQVLVGAVLAVCLADSYGASGVAFAFAVGELAAIGLLLPMMLSSRLGLRLRQYVIRCWAIALLALASTTAFGFIVVVIIPAKGIATLLLGALAWGVLSLPVLAWLATSRRQRLTALTLVRQYAARHQ